MLVAQGWGAGPHRVVGASADQWLQHRGAGAGEQRPPRPDGVDAGLAGGQVVQACAVLAFAEPALDAGSAAGTFSSRPAMSAGMLVTMKL